MKELLQNLQIRFQDFVYSLTEDHGWTWLDILIDALCHIEVNIRLAKNKELLENLRYGDVCPGPEYTCWNHQQIPKNELYCNGCPFHTISKVATFFYGEQFAGYCHYMNTGDFSFAHPTDTLWDWCKHCGVRDELNFEDAEITEEEIDV
jgi:hypothetical protein